MEVAGSWDLIPWYIATNDLSQAPQANYTKPSPTKPCSQALPSLWSIAFFCREGQGCLLTTTMKEGGG